VLRVSIERTTEAEIAVQAAGDEAQARDAATAYVRLRAGPTQAAFPARFCALRNSEQGKRASAGPARVLLRVLDRAPEAALAALEWAAIELWSSGSPTMRSTPPGPRRGISNFAPFPTVK
jgi:putative transcriptional regulator